MVLSLENRVRDFGRREREYKSRSEEEIARSLAKNGINFEYEKEAYVEDFRNGKSRIWYPDFYLPDLGVVIEYMGRPEDEDYREGMERKRKTYEEMGVKFIQIKPHQLWDPKEGKVKDNFDKYLVRRIEEEAKGRDNKLREASIKTNAFEDYRYGVYVNYN